VLAGCDRRDQLERVQREQPRRAQPPLRDAGAGSAGRRAGHAVPRPRRLRLERRPRGCGRLHRAAVRGARLPHRDRRRSRALAQTGSKGCRPHVMNSAVAVDGTPSQIEVWLSGAKITALSRTDSLGTTLLGRIEIGESAAARSYDVAYDDIVVTRTPQGVLSRWH